MANFTSFRGAFLDFLLADNALTALVKKNIHMQELATLHPGSIVYPCVTVRIARGLQSTVVHQRFPIIIGAHSDVSEDESISIIQTVGTRLQAPIFQTAVGNVVIFPSGTPASVYVQTARLWHIYQRWTCHRVGIS